METYPTPTTRALVSGEYGTMDRVTVYEDTAGEWRWSRDAAGNYEPLSMVSEGHPDPAHARAMALRCNRAPFVLLDDHANPGRAEVVE